MYVTANAEATAITEKQGQAVLSDMLEAAGLPPDCWPLDTDSVGELLQSAGYLVTGVELRRLAAMGQVPQISQHDARDVLLAATCLEGRRQWMSTPSPHDQKKTHSRLMLETHLVAGAAGVAKLEAQVEVIDLRFALVLMAECESRELREKLLTTIQTLCLLKGVFA